MLIIYLVFRDLTPFCDRVVRYLGDGGKKINCVKKIHAHTLLLGIESEFTLGN